MKIGDKIRTFGVTKYGSIKAFASEMDMQPSSLQSYMRDERLPGTPILKKLKHLGCSIDWLLDETDDKDHPSPKINEVEKLRLENKELKRKINNFIEAVSKLDTYDL